MNKKVYISGAISGLDLTREVKPLFRAAEKRIRALGHTPANPLENGLDPDASWSDHMRADIKLLCDCDMIWFLEGWAGSRGANLEHTIAQQLGLELYYD